MNREEVTAAVIQKSERRTEDARRFIGNAPDTLSAREAFRQAVSSLPGVSDDPDTVADIVLFADFLINRKEQLDRTVMSDMTGKCWIHGPHVRHEWAYDNRKFACRGQGEFQSRTL